MALLLLKPDLGVVFTHYELQNLIHIPATFGACDPRWVRVFSI